MTSPSSLDGPPSSSSPSSPSDNRSESDSSRSDPSSLDSVAGAGLAFEEEEEPFLADEEADEEPCCGDCSGLTSWQVH